MKKEAVLLLVLLASFFPTTMVLSADWKLTPIKVSPSDIPEKFDVTVTSGFGKLVEEEPIYPGRNDIDAHVLVDEQWYSPDGWDAAILVPQATGHYEIYVYVYLTNPSNKWAYATYPPLPFPEPPTNWYDNLDVQVGLPYNSYLFPLAANCTWNGQDEFVGLTIVFVDVVGTGGRFVIRLFGNQLRTDMNGDNVINILDIAIVATHYGTVYDPGERRDYDWNILLDNSVNYWDLRAQQVEFGREIPP